MLFQVRLELFEDVYEGRAVEMEDIGVKLKRILIDVESSVASGYSSREMRHFHTAKTFDDSCYTQTKHLANLVNATMLMLVRSMRSPFGLVWV